MVLNEYLNEEENELLKNHFNKFRNEMNNLIRNSHLFKEDNTLEGFFESKRTYNVVSGSKYLKSYLEISSIEYYEDDYYTEMGFDDKDHGCNSLKISFKEYSHTVNSDLFPMYLNDEDKEENYYKVKYNYNWFLDKRIKNELSLNYEEFNLLDKIFFLIITFIDEVKVDNDKRINNLMKNQILLINELDKDGNKKVDLIDGESFNKLLTKNQKSIIEIDKNYIQKFVKISIYLKTKKINIQKIFESIQDTKNDKELNELVNLLKNQIHTYELLVFHSISMITSLVESDLITFYEIYECFDQLGVFNSNWENEVSDKLTNIGNGLTELMYSIYQMENMIVNSINNLTYVTQDSFFQLQGSVERQLSSIDSSIKFNNLITSIQIYQMYKINQNTKRLG
jgi:hypothetical protein